jgi:hypothetical protein
MKAVIRRQDIPGLVMIAIIGIGLTFLGFVKIKNAADAKSWPVTNGVITSSRVAGAIKYYPSLDYKYMVDSIVYSSNSISNINFTSKNESTVEEFLKKYPLGSETKVYYNRLKPAKAFLEPGINNGNIILLAFGIFLLAIPVFLVIFIKVDFKTVSGNE